MSKHDVAVKVRDVIRLIDGNRMYLCLVFHHEAEAKTAHEMLQIVGVRTVKSRIRVKVR